MSAMPPWCPPPARPLLIPGVAHLWRVRLDSSAPEKLWSILSPDEQSRATRLRIPAKADEFVLGRASLRQILALYQNCATAELAFRYGRQGKPSLAVDGGVDLHFNLAHSGTWMLLAVTADGPVGIDLERIDTALDFVPLARRYFSAAEQEILQYAEPSRRRRTFYRLWTRKEAYLKGRGGGFAGAAGEDAAQSGWSLRHIFVGRGYVATLAEEQMRVVERWTMPWEE
jgi:4'-phosphopantetheinyl transferase